MRTCRVIRQLALLLAAACCGALVPSKPVSAQSVLGGIRGTVIDSLGPAAGVRVSLEGSAFTAVTDIGGRFALDHVPAGTYVVRAERSPAGEQTGEVTAVRVAGDATVTVDVRLGERGEADARAEAEGGLATSARRSGAQLAALPIDDSRQGLALMPGVEERGTELGIAAYPSLEIRGSPADQTAVFVDGAPARFETFGTSLLALPAGGLYEASVVTGAPGASVAEARGATAAYVTRAGGPHFEAGLAAGTDGPFSRNATVGFNHFDAFAGGPVPPVAHLTWFVSGALLGQSSQYRGRGADSVPTFALAGVDTVMPYTFDNPSSPGGVDSGTAVLPRFAQASGRCGQLGSANSATAQQIHGNYGLACQGLRQSLDWTTSRRAQAKLLYTYGDGSSVSLSGLASDLQQRDPPGAALADNALYTGTRAHSLLAVLNWSHRLRPLGGSLTLLGNLAFGWDGAQGGPLDVASEAATTDPAMGIEFSPLRFAGLEGLPLPLTDDVVRQMRNGTFRPPFYGRTDLAPSQQFRLNPYGVMGGWPTSGFGGEATVASESRVTGRLGAEWRATPALLVAAGADYSRTDLSFYDAAIVTGLAFDGFLAHPSRTGLFGEATLDEGPFVLDVGARADRYVTGSDFPKYPGRIYSNPVWSQGDTSYAARLSRTFDPGRTQTFVTPRVRIGFRAAEHTFARIGVSQQVEVPPYAMLFANVNTDLAGAAGATSFGRDVSYVTSTLIEGGIHHTIRTGLSVDISAYTKSNVTPYDFAGESVYDPYVVGPPNQPNESLVLLVPKLGTRATGGELVLEWGAGRPVSGQLSYSIERLHLVIENLAPGEDVVDPTNHVIAGTLVLRVPDGWRPRSAVGSAARGLSAAITGRLASGDPYTPLQNQGSGVVAPYNTFAGNPQGELFSANLPWTKALDLRVSKAVEVRGRRLSVYAEARNLLDLDNLVGLFAETGQDVNPLFRAVVVAPQVNGLMQDAGALWVQKPVTVNGVVQTLYGVDLSDCSKYPQGYGGTRGVVDCIALRRVEARWGNGDEFYDTNEISRALTAWYDSMYGTWAFHGPARTARIGIELEF